MQLHPYRAYLIIDAPNDSDVASLINQFVNSGNDYGIAYEITNDVDPKFNITRSFDNDPSRTQWVHGLTIKAETYAEAVSVMTYIADEPHTVPFTYTITTDVVEPDDPSLYDGEPHNMIIEEARFGKTLTEGEHNALNHDQEITEDTPPASSGESFIKKDFDPARYIEQIKAQVFTPERLKRTEGVPMVEWSVEDRNAVFFTLIKIVAKLHQHEVFQLSANDTEVGIVFTVRVVPGTNSGITTIINDPLHFMSDSYKTAANEDVMDTMTKLAERIVVSSIAAASSMRLGAEEDGELIVDLE